MLNQTKEGETQMKYSAMEKVIIKDCREMGYSNKVIADFLNKKEHRNSIVRTEDGVRKVKF